MQKTRLNPYISFKDTAREAMEFYKTVFGGELTMSTFKDAHSPHAADGDKIMHAMLEADNGIVVMASDTAEGIQHTSGTEISISLSGDNEKELRGYWDKLSEKAKTIMPLDKAPWGDTFGMLTDRFGIKWLVNIAVKKA